MSRAADTIWFAIPEAIARRVPTLGQMLGDGGWLRAWPAVATRAPIVAFAVGLATGLGHPVDAYTFADSIPLFVGLIAVSMLGGGLGAWAWLGYVVGDLMYGRFWDPNLLVHLVTERSGQLVVFLALFVGVVALPYGVTQLRRQTVASLPAALRGMPSNVVAQAVIAAFLVWSWVVAIPIMVSPMFAWRGSGGPIATIATLRNLWWLFPLVAAAVAAVRVVLERLAARVDPNIPISWEVIRPAAGHDRRRIGALVEAGLATVLLAGLVQTPEEALILAAGLIGASLLRAFVVPRLGAWPRLVGRVPAILRIVFLAGLGYGAALVTLESDRGIITTESYIGLILAVIAVAAVGALLFPGELEPSGPAAELEEPVDVAPLPDAVKVLVPVVAALVGWLIAPSIVRADDCSGAFDCFQTVAGGALAAAAGGALGGLAWALRGRGGSPGPAAPGGSEPKPPAPPPPPKAEPPKAAPPKAVPPQPANPTPRATRHVKRQPDGSRYEDQWNKDGSTTRRHYGPGGEPGLREEFGTGGSYSSYTPGGGLISTQERAPDGSVWTFNPVGGDGAGALQHHDANGNLIEFGSVTPDGRRIITTPHTTQSETRVYGPDGTIQVSSWTYNSGETDEIYYDPPP